MEKLLAPIAVQYVMFIADAAVFFISGYFILQGRNWARRLLVAWIPVQVLYTLVILPNRLMVWQSLFVGLLIIYVLYRRVANAFFGSNAAEVGIQNKLTIRQIIGISCYILAGSFLTGTSLAATMQPPSGAANTLVFKLIGFFGVLFPAAIFLSVGLTLSPFRRRKYEIGVVFLASALFGVLLMLMTVWAPMKPRVQESGASEKPAVLFDYATGSIWLGILAAVGGIGIYTGRERELDHGDECT